MLAFLLEETTRPLVKNLAVIDPTTAYDLQASEFQVELAEGIFAFGLFEVLAAVGFPRVAMTLGLVPLVEYCLFLLCLFLFFY